MHSATILIFAALEFEAAFLARRTGFTRDSGGWNKGVGETNYRIITVGPGASNLPTAMPANLRSIIMLGLAGGLDPNLTTSDLVLDQSSSGDLPQFSGRRGKIHTHDTVLGTPADKALLFESTGALVVDMENARVRAFASAHGIPFIGIRAIADTATECLDPVLSTFVDSVGRTKSFTVAMTLLRRPFLLRHLLHVRSISRCALESLSACLDQVILQTDPPGFMSR